MPANLKTQPDRPLCTESYLDSIMVTGRYSRGLVREFDAHIEHETANIFRIFHEIASLEGGPYSRPSQTKPAEEFRGPRLGGLWHKHHTQAHMMRENLKQHWRPERLRAVIAQSFARGPRSPALIAKRLADRIVTEGYLDRARKSKLTGEWIIFAKQKAVNYYLTLANHSEEDDAIWLRCKACAEEFTELAILQDDR